MSQPAPWGVGGHGPGRRRSSTREATRREPAGDGRRAGRGAAVLRGLRARPRGGRRVCCPASWRSPSSRAASSTSGSRRPTNAATASSSDWADRPWDARAWSRPSSVSWSRSPWSRSAGSSRSRRWSSTGDPVRKPPCWRSPSRPWSGRRRSPVSASRSPRHSGRRRPSSSPTCCSCWRCGVGGALVPIGDLPAPLAAVLRVLPMGALSEAFAAALGSGEAIAGPLAIVGAWAIGSLVLAARTFRWD